MAHELKWRRTQIGGVDHLHDFCAYVDNINVARIYRQKDSEGVPIWSIDLVIGDGFSGSSLTRREAIIAVEHQLARFLDTERGKEDPQTWPHDQRSVELRSLKLENAERYSALLEDLRNDRVERIQRRVRDAEWTGHPEE
jgi:hypothetical protein